MEGWREIRRFVRRTLNVDLRSQPWDADHASGAAASVCWRLRVEASADVDVPICRHHCPGCGGLEAG